MVECCIKKGLSIFHGDINEGLTDFANNSYDYVILSQTLQQINDPIVVMNEICRIGKFAIVIDPDSEPFLKGSSLDFQQEGLNQSFKFANPNVSMACGCGISVSFD